jgi:hypothetical protein
MSGAAQRFTGLSPAGGEECQKKAHQTNMRIILIEGRISLDEAQVIP